MEKLFDGCIYACFAMNKIRNPPLGREEMRVRVEKMFFEMAKINCRPRPIFIGGFNPVFRIIDDEHEADILTYFYSDAYNIAPISMKKLEKRRQRGAPALMIAHARLKGFSVAGECLSQPGVAGSVTPTQGIRRGSNLTPPVCFHFQTKE